MLQVPVPTPETVRVATVPVPSKPRSQLQQAARYQPIRDLKRDAPAAPKRPGAGIGGMSSHERPILPGPRRGAWAAATTPTAGARRRERLPARRPRERQTRRRQVRVHLPRRNRAAFWQTSKGDTKADAKAERAELLARMHRGERVERTSMTVGEVARLWLERGTARRAAGHPQLSKTTSESCAGTSNTPPTPANAHPERPSCAS